MESTTTISEQAAKNMKVLKTLVEGQSVKTHLVQDQQSGLTFVRKTTYIGKNNPAQNQKYAIQEMEVMKNINHPNIVKFIVGYVNDKNIDDSLDTVTIICEYSKNGNVQQLIQQCKETKIRHPEKDIWKMITQVCSALGYLHSHDNEYAHRNVNPESIQLDEHKNVKIGGFDFSKEQLNELSVGNTNIGCRMYFAPEMKKNPPIPYDKQKADVYAFGCTIYELCTFEGPEWRNEIKIGDGEFYSQELEQFVGLMMTMKFLNRPTIADLIKTDAFLKKIAQYGIEMP